MNKIIVFFLLIFSGVVTAQEFSSVDVAAWKKQATRVKIIRDNYGVPHVYGKTDADAIFGMLYAQCEDGFERVEMNYITALGRMAEVKGSAYIWQDLRARLFLDPDRARNLYENSPTSLKVLLDAFASGINYYLATHPEVKPKLIRRFEPWMHLLFSEGSIGGDIANVSLSDLSEFYSGTRAVGIAETIFPVKVVGSNGFAVAPSKSKSGNALFYINPHTTFYFRCEMQVVSDAGLNAYGAVTWGQLFLYQGFNQYCGWMHTSSDADVIDVYREKVIRKSDGFYYLFEGEEKKIESRQHVIRYLEGATINEVTYTGYKTHHGPVIAKQGDIWLAVKMMDNPVDAVTQSFMRTKANGYEQFRKNMDLKTNSSNNTVYADNKGNIGYWHGNFMPRRNEQIDWSKPVDGTIAATEWQGLHEQQEMIHILNPETGWIQNCNATPFTASGISSPSPSAYPKYMAPDAENFRGIHAQRLLEPVQKISGDELVKLAYDSYMPGFEKLAPAIVQAYDLNAAVFNPVLAEPVNVLRNWDFRSGISSVGSSLAILTGKKLMDLVIEMNPGKSMENIELVDAMIQQTSAVDKMKALQQVISQLERDFGKWNIGWGEVNRYQRPVTIENKFDDGRASLPVGMASSFWGSLAAYESRPFETQKWYGTTGNSFVAIVDFGKKIKAKSILTGGQSCDPASPYFTSQAEGYVDGKFKDVWYYRADVEKHAQSTYTPGQQNAKNK